MSVGASFLNNATVTILTNTGTSITAAYTHAPYGPTANTGTATNLPYLQMAALNGSASTPPPLAFTNPVQAGSTILVAIMSSDENAYFKGTTIGDGVNTYTVNQSPGLPFVRTFGFTHLGWAQDVAAGATTVTIGSSSTNALGLTLAIFELPAVVGIFSPGTHPLTAVYLSGSSDYLGSTSNLVNEIIT